MSTVLGVDKKYIWVAAGGVSGIGGGYNLVKHGFRGHNSFTVVSMGIVTAMCWYRATMPPPPPKKK
jgi:hypothetical protein